MPRRLVTDADRRTTPVPGFTMVPASIDYCRDPIPEALLEEMEAYLSGETRDAYEPDYWAAFVILETHGHDVDLMSSWLHQILHRGDPESPWSKQTPAYRDEKPFCLAETPTLAQERCILLALRQRARASAGMPLLTQDEQDAWQYRPKVYVSEHMVAREGDVPSDREVADAIAHVRAAIPEAMAAVVTISEQARQPPYSQSDRPPAINWLGGHIGEALEKIMCNRSIEYRNRMLSQVTTKLFI